MGTKVMTLTVSMTNKPLISCFCFEGCIQSDERNKEKKLFL